ncbi:MAG: glutamate 5-kinase [Phycisphaerales bacterium]|nr:glutamate 5-kinase [Phycisphaerales bacterium]
MPSTALRKQLMGNVHNLVVKVGTAVLTGSDGQLNHRLIARLSGQIARLNERGVKVTLVSSGAIGAGMRRAGLASRPRSIPMLQATAAVGQPLLMSLYQKTLAKYDLHVGQILVTRADFEQRSRYVKISNTIAALHRLHAIPIINENDTVAVDEIDRFADNDTIAAMVTNLLKADLMVILTVVDGLLDGDGRLVDLVSSVDQQVRDMVRAEKSTLGSGGMRSKLGAVKMVTDAGEGAVIAGGRAPNVLLRLLDGERVGTIFAPSTRRLSARQRWISQAVRPTGSLMLDAGAAEAVRNNGKSLLARGIIDVEGTFERGAIVRVTDPHGQTIAHGVSNYSRGELDKIKGLKSSEISAVLGRQAFDEAVHRDNMVLAIG